MPPAQPAIANYDDHTAEEIRQRLRKLSQADLAKLEAYEKQGQARSTVLEAVADLRTDAPWSGYDGMEVEEVNDALKQRDGDAARRVLEYERHHKGRTTVMEFARRRQKASNEPPAAPSRTPEQGETKARTRRQSAKSGSRARRSGDGSSSHPSQRGPKSGSSSRSAPGSSGKTEQSRTRAKSSSRTRAKTSAKTTSSSRTRGKTTSRPSATRSSGSGHTKSSRGGSRPRSQSSGGRQSRTQTRAAASAKIRKKATEALLSGQGRTKKLARDTEESVGSAAKGSRDALGSTVKDTGHAVQTVASKAKTPALVGGAALAALGGGIALGRGSKINLRKRKRVLGIPIPKRTTFGKAAKQMNSAVDSAGSAGKQVANWSDGLQELRQKLGNGNFPASKLGGGKSPVAKLTSKLPIAKLGEGKSPIQKLTDDDSPVSKLVDGKSVAAAFAKRVLS